MAALLVGLTTNVVLFLGTLYGALRLRTISAGFAALSFGIALIGAIHETAHVYQVERGLIFESVLMETLVGNYSIAQTMDHFGTGIGAIFIFILWRRKPTPSNTT